MRGAASIAAEAYRGAWYPESWLCPAWGRAPVPSPPPPSDRDAFPAPEQPHSSPWRRNTGDDREDLNGMTQTGSGRCSRRPTRAEINLDAVSHNMNVLRAAIGPHVQVMAVVKANGYGHGAAPIARACLEAGATWLGVG